MKQSWNRLNSREGATKSCELQRASTQRGSSVHFSGLVSVALCLKILLTYLRSFTDICSCFYKIVCFVRTKCHRQFFFKRHFPFVSPEWEQQHSNLIGLLQWIWRLLLFQMNNDLFMASLWLIDFQQQSLLFTILFTSRFHWLKIIDKAQKSPHNQLTTVRKCQLCLVCECTFFYHYRRTKVDNGECRELTWLSAGNSMLWCQLFFLLPT